MAAGVMEQTINQKHKLSARAVTSIAILSGVAFVLAFFEFPVPLTPSFARMDISDYPALIGAFAFGPAAGVMIELVKNMLQLMSSATGGVGELANFLMGSAYVWIAGFLYKRHKTKKMALIAGICGSVAMGIMAIITNYFILLPLFEQFMPLEEIIAAFGQFIPFIQTKLDVVLYNAFPFNVLKGLAITFLAMLTYKELSPVLKGTQH